MAEQLKCSRFVSADLHKKHLNKEVKTAIARLLPS